MAERRPLNRKRIMREFSISELSAVDSPAQKHALAVLMKRADPVEKTERTTSEVNGHTHTYDDAESGSTSTDEGHSHSVTVASDGTVTIGSAAGHSHEPAAVNKSNEGDEHMAMTDAEKKQIADLQKSVEDLTKSASTLKADNKDLADKLAKAEADKTAADLLAKMSDDEKEHMDSLEDETEKSKFREMSADERKRAMKKSAEANPVVYKSERTGEEFRKSDDPRLVKYAKQADADAEIAKQEREARESAEMAKRADEEPYKNFAVEKKDGTPTKVDVLRAISKMDAGPRAVLENWLGIGAKAVAAAFDKIGHSHEQAVKSANDFEKRIDEVQARDKSTRLAALEKAQREFPAEFKAYQESGVRAN